MGKRWYRLPRDPVQSPSLEAFKPWSDPKTNPGARCRTKDFPESLSTQIIPVCGPGKPCTSTDQVYKNEGYTELEGCNIIPWLRFSSRIACL